MPITWDARMWSLLYRQHREDGVITYGRAFFGDDLAARFSARADAIFRLGVTPGDRVLVVGCAFGFLVEQLVDRGVDAWGVDTSPFIYDAMTDETRCDIRLRIFSENPYEEVDWVIDEDAANSHSDDELDEFYRYMEDLVPSGRVIHLVTPGDHGDSAVNWKSLEEWRATAPDHHWIDARTA